MPDVDFRVPGIHIFPMVLALPRKKWITNWAKDDQNSHKDDCSSLLPIKEGIEWDIRELSEEKNLKEKENSCAWNKRLRRQVIKVILPL